MSDCHQYTPHYSRRDFLTKTTMGLGATALASLIKPTSLFGGSTDPSEGVLKITAFCASSQTSDLPFPKWRSISDGAI